MRRIASLLVLGVLGWGLMPSPKVSATSLLKKGAHSVTQNDGDTRTEGAIVTVAGSWTVVLSTDSRRRSAKIWLSTQAVSGVCLSVTTGTNITCGDEPDNAYPGEFLVPNVAGKDTLYDYNEAALWGRSQPNSAGTTVYFTTGHDKDDTSTYRSQ